MSENAVPDGYHTVTPYIVVPDAEGLIEFMAKAFGGKERMRMDGENGAITHEEVEIGDSVIMIASSSGEVPPKSAMLHLYVADVDESYKRAVEAGGESMREPRKISPTATAARGSRMAGAMNGGWQRTSMRSPA